MLVVAVAGAVSLVACRGSGLSLPLARAGGGSVGSPVRASVFLCLERGWSSFSLVPQKPFIRPAGMLCGVSFSGPLHSALRASRVGDTSPAACRPAGKAGKASPFNKGEDP